MSLNFKDTEDPSEEPTPVKCMNIFGQLRLKLEMENHATEEDVAKKVSQLVEKNSHLQSAFNYCLENTPVRYSYYMSRLLLQKLSNEDEQLIKTIPPHYIILKEVQSMNPHSAFIKEMIKNWPPLKIFFHEGIKEIQISQLKNDGKIKEFLNFTMNEAGDVILETKVIENNSTFSSFTENVNEIDVLQRFNVNDCPFILLKWKNVDTIVTEDVKQTIRDINNFFEKEIGITQCVFNEGKGINSHEMMPILNGPHSNVTFG